jgi:predicted ATPase
MIVNLKPGRFKCFGDETFALGKLTLLTGANGAGKSSLLQLLLLLRQASDPSDQRKFVRLTGPHMLQLGRAADVFNLVAGGLEHGIAAEVTLADGGVCRWSFTAETEDDLVLLVEERPKTVEELPLGLREDFTYLSAERLGPRDLSPLDAAPSGRVGVGVQGEFTAQVLLQRERERIRPALHHPSTDAGQRGLPVYLGKQVELWMRDLVPGLELRVQSFEGANAVALRMRRSGAMQDWLRPTNMAFGVSYALPVIVAGLLANPGALLLVENPEVHLHPSAQSSMGRFLATVAAAGAQVVVETHSDHVLNGVRLAVAQKHPLRAKDVVVHHFEVGDGQPRFTRIDVSEGGDLSTWPTGFFDQSEKDLAQLIKARREARGK